MTDARDESEAMKAMRHARRMMRVHAPFWGHLALKLDIIEDESIPTAATDGSVLRFNPQYVMSLPELQRRGLVAHEVMHCALDHINRLPKIHGADTLVMDDSGRMATVGNIAADIVGNEILQHESSQLPLPTGALLVPKYSGWSTDAVVADLLQELQKNPKKVKVMVKGSQGCGTVEKPEKGKGESESEYKERMDVEQSEWKAHTAASARMAGAHCPDFAKDVLAKLKKPKYDYREITAQFVERAINYALTWKRPKKRLYASTGSYLPAVVRERVVPTIVALIDTSGSMGTPKMPDSLVAKAARDIETLGVLAEKTVVIAGDTVPRWTGVFEIGEPVEVQAHGGGGTNFHAMIEEAAKHDPTCILYFTDMECNSWGEDPGIPVMWICWRDYADGPPQPPYGDVVQMGTV